MLKELAKKFNIPLEELQRRFDGRVEWICQHGIGHTIWHPEGSDSIHGCDGCCKKLNEHKGEVEQ